MPRERQPASRPATRRTCLAASALLLLAGRAGAEPDGDPPRSPVAVPAQVTQVWPPHADGAERPALEARDTDPNAPVGGGLWRWVVAPGRPAPALAAHRTCAVRVVPVKPAGAGWVEDPQVYVAGELSLAQQTRDGRDLWESDGTRGAWSSGSCARALPATGFTFQVAITRKELALAKIQRVRFLLTEGTGATPSDAGVAIDAWTDPFGERRSVPLTAPVTDVGLAPVLDGSHAAAAGWGLRGIVLVRGAQAEVRVRHAGAAAGALSVYTSLERDFDGDDPSPSGLRSIGAPVPDTAHVGVTAVAATLDAAGAGAFTIRAPDEPVAVGLSFYVQAGVGPAASLGLSCALQCTLVASLADYDGDGRANAVDAYLLDPER